MISSNHGVRTCDNQGAGLPPTMLNCVLPLSHKCVPFLLCLLLSVCCSGQTYTITTVAGSLSNSPATAPFGDGGPATAARLHAPLALAVDSAGNLYIADWGNNRVRKVSQQGIITTFAGTGNSTVQCGEGGGYSGDGGPATKASLNCPSGLAIDRAGNVYIADEGNFVIRKVTSDGTISTFAGQSAR